VDNIGIFNRALNNNIKNEATQPTGGGLQWLGDWAEQNNPFNSEMTKESSLTVSAVYACVNVRANCIASMPLQTFLKGTNGSTKLDNDVSYLLETRPNPYMTPFKLKHTLSTHVDLYGNGYVWMETVKGTVKNLWILNPLFTYIYIDPITGVVTYNTTINSMHKTFLENEIIHVTDMALDGIRGKSKIDLLREQLRNMRGSSKLLGKYLKQGTTTSGLITYPTVLDEDVKETIRDSWQKSNSGSDNFGKVAILDMGLDYKETNTLKFADQQFLETTKFTDEEIARVFSVPPHMIGIMDKSSFNNIQQQSLDFVMKTIQPILTLWEQEFSYKVFSKNSKLFVEFNMSSALRSDDVARANFYQIMQDNGIYTINDVLRFENKNTIGDIGDKRYRSLNFVSIDKMDEYQLAKAKSGINSNIDKNNKDTNSN